MKVTLLDANLATVRNVWVELPLPKIILWKKNAYQSICWGKFIEVSCLDMITLEPDPRQEQMFAKEQ